MANKIVLSEAERAQRKAERRQKRAVAGQAQQLMDMLRRTPEPARSAFVALVRDGKIR